MRGESGLTGHNYRSELERKTRSLATYGGFTDVAKVEYLISRAWDLESQQSMTGFVF
jgi:aconitate decarboxylase